MLNLAASPTVAGQALHPGYPSLNQQEWQAGEFPDSWGGPYCLPAAAPGARGWFYGGSYQIGRPLSVFSTPSHQHSSRPYAWSRQVQHLWQLPLRSGSRLHREVGVQYTRYRNLKCSELSVMRKNISCLRAAIVRPAFIWNFCLCIYGPPRPHSIGVVSLQMMNRII